MYSRNVPQNSRESRQGFSLIEMAIVMIVMGLIVTIILPLIVTQIKHGKVQKGRETVRMARDEIIGYALNHFNSSTGTTCLPSAVNGDQHENQIPAALGHTKDPWTKKLYYYPASGTHSGNPSNSGCFNPCSSSAGLNLEGAYESNQTAFVVVSSGDNYRLEEDLEPSNGTITTTIATKSQDILEFVKMYYLCSQMPATQGDDGDDDDEDEDEDEDEDNGQGPPWWRRPWLE